MRRHAPDLSPMHLAAIETAMCTLLGQTRRHVDGGGLPFGAAVVGPEGDVVATGFNQVRPGHDPTAHAEIVAIRSACRRLRQSRLWTHLLLATGEPCGLCYAAARWSGIATVYFALDRDEVAAYGFDYRESYRPLPAQFDHAGVSIQRLRPTSRHAPFENYSSRHARGY